jgi:hypothetical protein
MNVDEICKMMDAIHEGKPGMLNLGVGFNVHFSPGISFIADEIGVLGRITESKQARELAVMLITWADRQDGQGGVSGLIDALKPLAKDDK